MQDAVLGEQEDLEMEVALGCGERSLNISITLLRVMALGSSFTAVAAHQDLIGSWGRLEKTELCIYDYMILTYMYISDIIYTSKSPSWNIHVHLSCDMQVWWISHELEAANSDTFSNSRQSAKWNGCCLPTPLGIIGSLQIIGKNMTKLPSRELTYPPKMAFWRWFSFSQGGIC